MKRSSGNIFCAISPLVRHGGEARRLRAVSVNILHNGSDAEECVSDTYLACWNTIPAENPRSLKAYAGTLCRYISFGCYKRAHAQKRGGGRTEMLLSEIEDFLPAEGSGADYEETDAAEAINEFLSSLKSAQRVVCRGIGFLTM
ncbi:MAG: RNA polymerase sigma factor [Christensenellaceae bacterium]